MRSGRLRTRITIETNIAERSDSGAEVANWQTFATRWAEQIPQGGREFVAAWQLHAETTHLFVIRRPLAVTPEMRLRIGARLFDVISITDKDRDALLILAKEGHRIGS